MSPPLTTVAGAIDFHAAISITETILNWHHFSDIISCFADLSKSMGAMGDNMKVHSAPNLLRAIQAHLETKLSLMSDL